MRNWILPAVAAAALAVVVGLPSKAEAQWRRPAVRAAAAVRYYGYSYPAYTYSYSYPTYSYSYPAYSYSYPTYTSYSYPTTTYTYSYPTYTYSYPTYSYGYAYGPYYYDYGWNYPLINLGLAAGVRAPVAVTGATLRGAARVIGVAPGWRY